MHMNAALVNSAYIHVFGNLAVSHFCVKGGAVVLICSRSMENAYSA